MNKPKAQAASAANTPDFPSVVKVLIQLKADRELYLYGPQEQRCHELRRLANDLSHTLNEQSTSLESLWRQLAFRRFCVLTGFVAVDNPGFSATIAYDADLLNGPLANGLWNTLFHANSKTMEVSTHTFR